MIYEMDINLRRKLFPMFKNMNDTIILSCLQGHMGTAWADDLENPTVAQISVGIFVFYAGDPNAKAAEELLYNLPENIDSVNTTFFLFISILAIARVCSILNLKKQ